MSSDSPETSLVKSIGKSGGYDLLTDASELVFDQLLEDGPLKDVPFVGSLVKLYKVGVGAREYLLLKKLRNFLSGLQQIPSSKREEFSKKIEADPEERTRVGEKLFLLLERFDDLKKPELLGKAFVAYIEQTIDFAMFHRIGRAIDRCTVEDLQFVHNFERATDAFSDRAFDLASCGLVEIAAIPTVRGPETKNLYKLTEFGELFVKIVLSEI